MPDTPTEDQHDWVSSTLGVDPRSQAAAPAEDGPRSGGVLSDIGGFFSKVGSSVADAVSQVGGAVVEGVSAAGHAVADAASEVGEAVVGEAKAVGKAAAGAAEAVAGRAEAAYNTVHDIVVPPPIPQARANKKLDALPPADRAKVQAVLDGAKSDKERSYITKAIASGHTPAEIEEFAKTIAGKDEAWMNDNLRLVGDSNGKGIRQQWSFSCAPTTVEAIKGELDPIYAMKLRKENPNFEEADNANGTAKSPAMAEDQRAMLEGAGGKATSRDDPEGKGKGMVFKTLLNKQSDDTGLTFDNKVIGKGYTPDDAMSDMESGLSKDVPVPITVGDAGSPYAHAALVVATDKGPPRTFTIHDPWYGATQTFTEDQIRNDQVSIGDWKHIGVVFPPSMKK